MLRADDADTVYFQVLGARGEFLAASATCRCRRRARARAGEELRCRDDEVHGEAVRVAYLWLPLRPARRRRRRRWCRWPRRWTSARVLATEIIKGVMLPQFVILPLAVLLVWFALVRGIKPLNELQQRIRRRAEPTT